MELERLLKFGYFPKELPPPFSTIAFADFATQTDLLEIIRPGYVNRDCIHNLARIGNQRRALNILNPFNFYLVAKLIAENSDEIDRQLMRSKMSLSKPILDERDLRAYVPFNDGNDKYSERAKLRAGARFVLRTDISRFYNSIYTHSIPWALVTKKIAKQKTKGGFGNDLDLYTRNGQDKQTLGIPVGPDTSLIISELICSAIDERIQEKKIKGLRFVDDFEFTFLTRGEAEQALPVIETILRDFELALNPLKTRIDELPILFDNQWRVKVKEFRIPKRPSSNELLQYFDLLFDLFNNNKTEPVLRYGIARLKSIELFTDTDVLIDLLSQCILIEPGTLQEALFLIEKNKIKPKKNKLSELIRNLIIIHGPMKHGSEVAWALWTAIFYEVKIPIRVIDNLANFDDSIIGLLSLDANRKGLLSNSVKGFWKDMMNKENLNAGQWLLAYEADHKGWLTSSDSLNHIDADVYFRLLKQNNVAFYKQDIDYVVSKSQLSYDYGSERTDGSEEVDNADGFEDYKEWVPTANSSSDDLPF